MKTLALAACFASATSLMASDLYITGSTAFRANVYSACTRLFDAAPKIVYGPTSTGGDGTATSGNPQWTMIGSVSNLLGGVVSGPFTIHGYFTGSIQGTKSVEQLTPLLFVDANTNVFTNTSTIAFADTASAVSPFPATGSFSEEKVCVQPFVYVKSAPTDNGIVGGNPTGAVTNISNISWEQAKYLLSAGNAPLAFWTGKSNDTSLVYFVNRTKDSGTRMSYLREEGYTYNQGLTTYIFSLTNGFWYKAANNNITQGVVGESNAVFQVGIVSSGAEIFNAANLGFGPGYVGGGDIKTEMGYHTNANQAVSFLSIADAKGILAGAPNNWSQVISFGGVWPTAAGAGIHGQTVTNDYSPIIWGNYPLWNYEVLIYPNVDPSSLSSDQNLTAAQLGNGSAPGTILGVLNHQTTGTPTLGSIENEIELSKTNLATAIRLSDMNASRSTPGGVITP